LKARILREEIRTRAKAPKPCFAFQRGPTWDGPTSAELLARHPSRVDSVSFDDQRARRGLDEPAEPKGQRTDSGIDRRKEQLMAHAEASGPLSHLNHEIVASLNDFHDPRQEWRRLFSELLGTFFLVLVAAGGGMMGQAFPGTISRSAAVVAPGLMVMAIILFMGKVSGAHLNPAVSIAFSMRGDFPWRRVPGYIVAQLIGATLAALFLHAVINVSASYGSNYPASGYSATDAFLMEGVLTLGLVSVILGTASGAQNIGIIGAIGVGAYIALAGLWGSPISGASMNPARTFGPNFVATDFASYWVYVAGPLVGAVLAVGAAWVLRGAGGGRAGSGAAQGSLFTEVEHPEKG
jgi:aquaporin Z